MKVNKPLDWENDPYLLELARNHAAGKGGWELIEKYFRRLLAAALKEGKP